jgi:hypothetical protein|tara:strand:- start:695 stop:880 length:186 start_codon:yes stop_codon:yes gene_type:complete
MARTRFTIFYIPVEYWATYFAVGLTAGKAVTKAGGTENLGNRFAAGTGILACIGLYKYRNG